MSFGILFLLLALRIADPGALLANLRLDVFDFYQRMSPRTYQPVPVRIVDIDDESLERLGQWPWPRTAIAEIVRRLTDAGAAVIAFDIVFAEPDRTSPKQVIPLWPLVESLGPVGQLIERLPDHDNILAHSISDSGRVVTGFVLTPAATPKLPPAVKSGFAHGGDDPRQFLAPYRGAVASLDVLQSAAAGNGSFNMEPDHDATVRRVPLILRLGDQLYPSLVSEALRVAQGASSILIKSSGASGEDSLGASTGIVSVRIGQFTAPVDAKGRLFVHYTRDEPGRYIPAWRILDGSVPQDELEGHVLIVGTSASGLKDIRTSPVNAAMPGVEAHANAAEQILLGHFLERPDWAEGAELLYVAALGTALIVLLLFSSAIASALTGIAGMAIAIGGSWFAFTDLRLLVDPITPSLVVITIYLAASLLVYARTESERRQVRTAFAQYLSPALVEQLASHPERLALGGETRQMTMLFCDIRGFTSISETYRSDPQGLTRLINRFLTPLTNVILSRNGTIDKYMGDCIMAFWNAPIDDPDHARHAGEAALAMFSSLGRLNGELEAEARAEGRDFIPLRIGIGLNTGNVVVGNMGSDQRFDYSVLGDAVNLASRLEGQSKSYGVGIVIGEATQSAISDFACIEIDLIAVKGKSEAVRIFALLGDQAMAQSDRFRTLCDLNSEMLSAYRSGNFSEAEQAMARAQPLFPDLQRYFDLYAERIAAFRIAPPPPQWDGVFRATEK